MASERQIEANRRNARKSTGPRSKAGRRRAARNALKYGLSIANNDAIEINKLAIKISGPTQDFEILEVSWIIAAAEIELRRVRRVRVSLFETSGMSDLEQSPKRSFRQQPLTGTRIALRSFKSIQRYERRAISRRDKALRHLLSLKTKRKR
jgi:hypothetical protein